MAGVKSSGSDHLGNQMNDLFMDSFPIPLPELSLEDPIALPSAKINDKIFRGTLKDAKVSAMQYFDGLLYLLFDNAHKLSGHLMMLAIWYMKSSSLLQSRDTRSSGRE